MIEWNRTEDKFYEDGLDRGVLYPLNGLGVPWNGLISIDETTVGGESQSFHYDGDKYLELVSNEDFQATLTAFGAPTEFSVCDGSQQIAMGLFATHQPRQTFGMSYRTGIGNEEEGDAFGYKIHMVYNCLAQPAARTRRTRSNEVTPENIAWTINTVPIAVPGMKATAHIILDTRTTPTYVLERVEAILYESRRLPTIAEMIGYSEQIFPARLVEIAPDVWELYESSLPLSNVIINEYVAPQTELDPFLWLVKTPTVLFANVVQKEAF